MAKINVVRPPVITIMGHIDHGKTTLLDTIRKTNSATREYGGITQHIGAYQVDVNSRRITFIDTPGHAAFEQMRNRGANVADIVILVIAADDGVMPQTVEAIRHIQAASIPMIVAINKTDRADAAPERVKKQLSENGVYVEGYGGDTVAVPISAKTGAGISELLEMVVLVADLRELKSDPGALLKGVVIEARLDRHKGPVATVLVQEGTLQQGMEIYAGSFCARVRRMMDALGTTIKEAGPSTPVEVMGWEAVPEVGALVGTESIREHTAPLNASEEIWNIPTEKQHEIKLIVRADVKGSLEVINAGIGALGSEDALVTVIAGSTGDVTESDVLLARSTGAYIVGFNVKVLPSAAKLAETERVVVRMYRVIYELFDEIAQVITKRVVPKQKASIGQGEVIAIFEGPNRTAGVKVSSGSFRIGEKVIITRNNEEVGEATITSMRHVKETIQKATAPLECGMRLDPALDFQRGDKLESSTP